MIKILLGLLLLSAGTSATAQSARTTVADLAECTVKRDPAATLRFLETPVDNPGYAKFMAGLVSPDCSDRVMTVNVPPVALRGSLFEALYKRDFAGTAADLRSAPQLDYGARYQRPLSVAASNALALSRAGDCVVRADPDAARRLIATGPDSPAEDGAMAAVATRLGACVDKGESIPFARSTIRALVAEGLYRLTAQSVGTGAAQ